jgi:hypothetical protein
MVLARNRCRVLDKLKKVWYNNDGTVRGGIAVWAYGKKDTG